MPGPRTGTIFITRPTARMPHPAKRIQNLPPEAVTELFVKEHATQSNSPEALGILQAFGERVAASGFPPDQMESARTHQAALSTLYAIEPDGVWRTQAETPRLSPPSGLLRLPSGDLAVADDFNHRIQIYAPDMQLKHQFGAKGKNAGEFQYPKGMAVDAQGHLYVADSWNHRVQKFDGSGKHVQTFGGYGEGFGQMNEPYDVCVDAGGRVIVAERYNHRIQFFEPDGASLGWLGSRATVFEVQLAEIYETAPSLLPRPGLEFPTCITADAAGCYYLTDSGNHRVLKFDSDWNLLWAVGRQGGGLGEFQYPMCVTTDGGLLYVADLNNDRIQVLTTEGVPVQAFGRADAKTPLKMPSTVLAGPDGRLWVGLTLNASLFGFKVPVTDPETRYAHLAQVRPDSMAVHGGRGRCREQAGQYDAAFKDYTRAVELCRDPAGAESADAGQDEDAFARPALRLAALAGAHPAAFSANWSTVCLEALAARIQTRREQLLRSFKEWSEHLPLLLARDIERQNRILENREDPLAFDKELHELKMRDQDFFRQTRSRMFAYRAAIQNLLSLINGLLRLSLQPDALEHLLKTVQSHYLGTADVILSLLQEKEGHEATLVDALQAGKDNAVKWPQFVTRYTLNAKLMEQVPQLLVELLGCLRLLHAAAHRFPEAPQACAVFTRLATGTPEALKFPRLLLGLQEDPDLFNHLTGILKGLLDTWAARFGKETPVPERSAGLEAFTPYLFDSEHMEPVDWLRSLRVAGSPVSRSGEGVQAGGEAYLVSRLKGQEETLAGQLQAVLDYQQVYQQKTEELTGQLGKIVLQEQELENKIQHVDIRDKATPIRIGNQLMVIGFQRGLLNRMLLTLGINEQHNLARLVSGTAVLFAADPARASGVLTGVRELWRHADQRTASLTRERKKASQTFDDLQARQAAWSQELSLEAAHGLEELKLQLAESTFQNLSKTLEVHRWTRIRKLLDRLLRFTDPPAAAPAPAFAGYMGSLARARDGFVFPFGVAHLPNGDWLVADTLQHSVARFSKEGVFQQRFSRFGNGPGALNQPYGLAVGPDQTVYVADSGNRRVQVFDAEGRYRGALGNRGEASQRLGRFFNVAVDGRGRIWVPDTDHHRIQVYAPEGAWVCGFGKEGRNPDDLLFPVSVCCLPDGGFVVADRSETALKRFDAEGRLVARLNAPELKLGESYGLCHDPARGLWVADTYHMQLVCLDLDLKPVWVHRDPGRRSGQLLCVGGLSVYGGRLYVADFDNIRVQVFSLPPP